MQEEALQLVILATVCTAMGAETPRSFVAAPTSLIVSQELCQHLAQVSNHPDYPFIVTMLTASFANLHNEG